MSEVRGNLFINAVNQFIESYDSVVTDIEYYFEEDVGDVEEIDNMVQNSDNIVESNVSEYIMDVEEDKKYKEFLRITRLHQKHVQNEKREKLEKNVGTEVDFNSQTFMLNGEEFFWADKVGIEGIKITSSNLPNEQKKKDEKFKEKEALYGNKAQEIMALEAKMELEFKEKFLELNPPIFPCVSLRIG
uniref:Uncharacterized protein n=1 Tax=Parastrongyloides trichosuri TaxID=131310 RepID=A0A0N4ZMY8_PARTI